MMNFTFYNFDYCLRWRRRRHRHRPYARTTCTHRATSVNNSKNYSRRFIISIKHTLLCRSRFRRVIVLNAVPSPLSRRKNVKTISTLCGTEVPMRSTCTNAMAYFVLKWSVAEKLKKTSTTTTVDGEKKKKQKITFFIFVHSPFVRSRVDMFNVVIFLFWILCN